jgi:hypothetical protein
MQILTHLVHQEQQTCERLDLVVRLYHDPLRDRSLGLLTFAQHWSLFSNLSTLAESQRTLFLRFADAVEGISSRYNNMITEGYSMMVSAAPPVASRQTSSLGSFDRAGLPPLPPRQHSNADLLGESPTSKEAAATGGSSPSSNAAIPPSRAPVIDPLELLAGVVESTFGHPSMAHFMAEHMMYTLNYGRTIFPMLNEIVEAVNSTAGDPTAPPATAHHKDISKVYAKLIGFLKTTSLAVTSNGLHKSYTPEVDPLAQGPVWAESAPAEELLLYLATPLASLQRYVLAARCLIEAHCFSGAAETQLAQFVQAAALRSAEEGSLLLDQCSSQEVAALVGRMDGFTVPPSDSRMLLHYGRLTKKFRRGRHSRLMFIFSDVLCYVEELSTGRMRVRGLLVVDAASPLAIRDVDDDPEKDITNCFEIVSGGILYVFFAESQVQKLHWIATLHYAVAAAHRRKLPQMVAKATSGDIITTVRSTWVTTQPNSRLGRQRREDTRLQLQLARQQQRPALSRVSSTASSGAATCGVRQSAPPGMPLGISTTPVRESETPTDRESRRKAMARQSLRASFDVSHWTQIPAPHSRVRSQDILGSFANHNAGELSLSFGLPSPRGVPSDTHPIEECPAEFQAMHMSMPPPAQPIVTARSPYQRHLDPQTEGGEDDEPTGADRTSLLM